LRITKSTRLFWIPEKSVSVFGLSGDNSSEKCSPFCLPSVSDRQLFLPICRWFFNSKFGGWHTLYIDDACCSVLSRKGATGLEALNEAAHQNIAYSAAMSN
jgi:hypothetical protein